MVDGQFLLRKSGDGGNWKDSKTSLVCKPTASTKNRPFHAVVTPESKTGTDGTTYFDLTIV
jgi:hypothetical protein